VTISVRRITLDPVVNITIAESVINDFSRQDINQPVCLDLSHCRAIDIGAGYRLGNLLRRLSSAGELTVQLPPEHYTEQTGSPNLFHLFTRSGLGPAIARHAKVITSGNVDVSSSLKEYYTRTLSRPSQNSVYIADAHLGAVDLEDEARFARLLTDLLRRVNVNVVTLDRRPLGDVIAFCFEATQNVLDHAAKSPLRDASSIFSYLALRYHAAASVPSEGDFAGYVKRAGRELSATKPLHWLEIVVNDDGNGIPARQTQNPEIYWSSIQAEEEALGQALSHSSVKIRAGDSKIRGSVAGLGFTRIRNSLRQLRAFASLRSGRCLATFDGLSTRRDEFYLHRGGFGLALGFMPGTAIQVVVPIIPDEKQQGLPFDQ